MSYLKYILVYKSIHAVRDEMTDKLKVFSLVSISIFCNEYI